MALSFEESRKQLSKLVATPMTMALNNDDIATVAETWSKPSNAHVYAYHNGEYEDKNVSTVDADKNITLSNKQINLTQEKNSQYIPFEIPRHYDGFDLSKTELTIYWVNQNGEGSFAYPVDVYCSTDKIRFAWLVNDDVTAVAGKVKFEIQATGKNSKGNTYVWKTKANDGLNVLQALEIKTFISPDDSWQVDFITKISQERGAAERAAEQAANALSQITTIKGELVGIKDSLMDGIDKEVADTVSGVLVDYALKSYVQDEIKKVDVSGQLVDYAKKTDIPTKVSELENDSDYLIESDLDGFATEGYVQEEIKKVDVSDQLADYVTKIELETTLDGLDITEQLVNYATKDELKVIETSVDTVRKDVVTNAESILKVSNDLSAIQSSLNALEGDNKNLIIQYDEVGSILHLYERDENGDITITDGDEQVKVKEIYYTIITGAGGGGGALVSTIKLSLRPDGDGSATVLYGNPTSLNYNLSTRKAKEGQDEEGNDVTIYEEAIIPGDITFTLYRDNVYLTHFTVKKTSSDIQSGSIDISDYIVLGNQVFTITASYVEQLGSDGESITIRSSANWAINAVNIGLTELPNSLWETTPKYGSTTFSYTPIGAIEKTVYFKIDENEPDSIVTSLNGTSLSYVIPKQSHGVHTLQVWCEGNVGGTLIKTEPYKYILMFVEDGNDTPIIRIKAPTTLEQYSSADIYYNVFDPSSATIKSVTIYDEDGVVLSSAENITSAEQKLEFRPSVVKTKIITVQYKEATAFVTIEVTKFPYEINAVIGDLMVDFVPTGRSNSDADYNVFKNNAYTIETDSDTGEETQKEIPITWTFSENFDWINGGWKRDTNGDTYFCVKAGTSVDINYNLFGTDGVIAKKDANGEYKIAGTGKEFKLIFKTTNVAQANATWLRCVDVADKKSLGIRMEAQNAYIDSGLGTLEIPYVDDDIIEFDMNIVPVTEFLEDGSPNLKTKAIPMVMTYEDGTSVQPKVISSASTSFKQDSPKPITIGSEYCDVHIYRMKVYERYLEDKEIITNFIADARSGVEMAKRYIRNDIYPIENKRNITPESVAAACPDLKVYVVSAPHFTNDKGDKVANTTIRQIHNTGTKENPRYDASENWTATGATHNGQGTSSNEYGYSGRNLEFNMKKATITLNDNVTVVKEIQLSPTSYPTNYLNFKINIASSENANNALLQKRYDRYLPYTSVASLIDDRKKNSMEFFNCVVFIQETDENIDSHREFSDTNIHFYGIGNIGDSKKTDDTRVNDVNDENEFCVEIMDWNRHLSSFPMDTMVSTLYTDNDGKQILRFENFLIDENLGEDGILYEKDDTGNYYHSVDTTVDKAKTYYIDILENDDFSEDYTYGFRYIQSEWKKEDDPDYKSKNEAFQKPLRQKWIEFYRFVTRDLTTDGNEDAAKVNAWKSEFSNWFVFDAALYYYLYTLRYTMVDNRAKNTFWHWGKHYLTFEEALARGIAVYDENKNLMTDVSNPPSRFYDINGNEIKNINASAAAINNGYRMDFWDYDNDTSLGIDNAGKLEIPFGVEEDDVDFAGVPYFRAHDSLVFARIAKYFVEELENAWHNTEINPIGKAFDSTSFINEFDTWQNEFPEELWRLDYERKYKRTYVGGTGSTWDNALPQSNKSDIVSTRFLTEMMNGRKKYQRRCFERNQEVYMSSKFKGEVNLNDSITLRGTGRPTDKVVTPNFAINIVPFSKMYINLYSATDKIYYHKKCEAGVPCEPIPYPETTLDFIYIRGASQVQSLGDLSPMYLQTAELTSGSKLKAITLGNATTGYSNDALQTLQIGVGNKLLEELDIRNLSNLTDTVLPVSNIPSLKRVYAQGSNISEAVFANNGLLEEAYLPATTTRLELRNLHYLNTINLESYDNLLHLVVMNCSDATNNLVLDMIQQATDLQTLRVTNVDWTLNNTDVLKRLYKLIKTQNSPEVVMSGVVTVPTIGQHDLDKYKNVWPELTITARDGVIPQYVVTFMNGDTVLDVQYVDIYNAAIDPTNKSYENYIGTPSKESTIQYRYEFSGWDKQFANIQSNLIVYAQYTQKIREYTVRYEMGAPSKGTEIKTYTNVPYGSNATYDGDIPTYTLAEPTTYYLFKGWDKSGIADGDFNENGVKVISAMWDVFESVKGFNNPDGTQKKLNDLSPIEVYALLDLSKRGKVNIGSNDGQDSWNYSGFIADGDEYTFTLGHDFDYSDVESTEIIGKNSMFGDAYKNTVEFVKAEQTYFDTGIQLFDEDKDFVLAIDYEFTSSEENSVLAQCFRGRTNSGFKLLYSDGTQLQWGNTKSSISGVNEREVVVIRHTKGNPNLTVYTSNLSGMNIKIESLAGSELPGSISDTLVFGCEKQASNTFANYASGKIHWAKLWHKDIGEAACKEIASWVHEDVSLQACGFNRYYISNSVEDEMCSFSLLATHLLSTTRRWNPSESDAKNDPTNKYGPGNIGGWAKSELNAFLNTRLYAAMPSQIKALIKPFEVLSTIGSSSTDLSSSSCYIAIPSIAELQTVGNYARNEGSKISYINTNNDRKRAFRDADQTSSYWTRSPHAYDPPTHSSAKAYVNYITGTGSIQTIGSVNNTHGILIMISF